MKWIRRTREVEPEGLADGGDGEEDGVEEWPRIEELRDQAWGSNLYGQLGDGTLLRTRPTRVVRVASPEATAPAR